MKRFEILPHTADVRIRAEGSTRPALFVAALQGMFVAAEPEFVGEETDHASRPFKLAAADFPSLLVDLLNEAIAASDTHREAYDDITFSLATDTKAEGSFLGRPVVRFGTQIKAATHHGLSVQKNDEGNWEATIVFDA